MFQNCPPGGSPGWDVLQRCDYKSLLSAAHFFILQIHVCQLTRNSYNAKNVAHMGHREDHTCASTHPLLQHQYQNKLSGKKEQCSIAMFHSCTGTMFHVLMKYDHPLPTKLDISRFRSNRRREKRGGRFRLVIHNLSNFYQNITIFPNLQRCFELDQLSFHHLKNENDVKNQLKLTMG